MSCFRQNFLPPSVGCASAPVRWPVGGVMASTAAACRGAVWSFRDYRPYVAGDDMRRVDWNLYRRSGRLFTRLCEEMQDLPVYVLMDMSDSMFFENPPRADAARQAAAAFAAMALNQHDRVSLWPFGQHLGRPLPAASGKNALGRLLAGIEALTPAGTTDMVASLQRFGHWRLRQGLAVIVSDFFDPQGLDRVLDALLLLRHRFAIGAGRSSQRRGAGTGRRDQIARLRDRSGHERICHAGVSRALSSSLSAVLREARRVCRVASGAPLAIGRRTGPCWNNWILCSYMVYCRCKRIL